jgi:pilus assembly protein CpaB
MSNIGQTIGRLGGALLLAASATAVDHPQLFRSTAFAIPTVPVVTAVRDIARGSVIPPSALRVAEWPKGTEPAKAYDRVESVAGRVSRVPIFRGDAIVPGRLAPTGATAEPVIASGLRAYSVRVNHASTFAPLVRPDSRVDVMVVTQDPRKPEQPVAEVALTNIRILAIDLAPRRDGEARAANVTLEVFPEQAELLATAAVQGQVQLVLRALDDYKQAPGEHWR